MGIVPHLLLTWHHLSTFALGFIHIPRHNSSHIHPSQDTSLLPSYILVFVFFFSHSFFSLFCFFFLSFVNLPFSHPFYFSAFFFLFILSMFCSLLPSFSFLVSLSFSVLYSSQIRVSLPFCGSTRLSCYRGTFTDATQHIIAPLTPCSSFRSVFTLPIHPRVHISTYLAPPPNTHTHRHISPADTKTQPNTE